jgi:DNA-binding NarL/FixJ family response regulator
MTPIRVLLADDHPIVREGIRKSLGTHKGIEIVGEASQGDAVLGMVEDLSPDVLLLDMEMPGLNGVEIARQLKQKGVSTRILALSAHNERHYIEGLLSIGASGYLLKGEVPEAIAEAIRGVASGENGWLSRKVAAQFSSIMEASEGIRSQLTPREIEILEGLVSGKTNKQIALKLDISDRTVEKYVASIYSKMGVSSRVEAAVNAVQENLVHVDQEPQEDQE